MKKSIRKQQKRKPSMIVLIFLILLCSMTCMISACEWTITSAGNELKTKALETCRAEIGHIGDALYSQLTTIQMQNLEILNNESVLALAMRSSILNKYETISCQSTVMRLIRSRLSMQDLNISAQLFLPLTHTLITAQKAATVTEQETEKMLEVLSSFPNGLFYDSEDMGFWNASPLIHDFSEALNSRIMITRIQRSSLRDLLRKYASPPNDYQLLLSIGGHVIAHSGDAEYDERLIMAVNDDSSPVTIEGSSYYLIRSEHESSELSITAILPVDKVMRNMVRLQHMLRMLECICLLIILLSVVAFYRIFVKPLKSITAKLRDVGDGDLTVRMSPGITSELDNVVSTFNGMTQRLQQMIDREYKSRLLAVSAEKKALQYQITPHFLYNTYFQLRNLILLEEKEQAGRLADLMGRYLRYIVHQDGVTATLGEEIDHARNYADIQSMRFRDRIEVRYDIPDGDWRRLTVPCLLIQPLIENAFGHGLKDMEKGGIIVLSLAAEADRILISVEDNGNTLSDKTLEALRRSVAEEQRGEGESVALVNIHRRLQLYFGSQSRLIFEQSELGGLKTTVMIVTGKE